MTALPEPFRSWFTSQGWKPHAFQLQLLKAKGNRLLIAPTGGGKTLAGFLPSLVDLAQRTHDGLHTLYISPLKSLTSDVARNLSRPVEDMGLNITIDNRTGDTPTGQRVRQRAKPPHILLTTPESLALLVSYPEAQGMFGGLARVVIDELHALAESKRGDQLMLCLARLQSFAPQCAVVGLSATVENPADLAQFMGGAEIIHAKAGPAPKIALLPTKAAPPWSGAGGRYAVNDVLSVIKKSRSSIVFVNTRAQAELFFQAIWLANKDNLPIALHHGSLAREQREKVEAAMGSGELRAVIATGSLDLGLDWGDVDVVIQIGNPRQIKRLVQRIGRSNHQFNKPSRAWLVPANRFDVIECTAAIEAVLAGELDGTPRGQGPLEVLCQHILIVACSGPFSADVLFAEVRRAGPYVHLSRQDFDACLDCAATGGYVLRRYEMWQRLVERDGVWQLRDPRSARVIRMNVGTIIGREMVAVKAKGRGGGQIGQIEENFAALLQPGDTFLLSGKTLRYDRTRGLTVEVTPHSGKDPKIPVYGGQAMASSVELSRRVFGILTHKDRWSSLPVPVQSWLCLQQEVSRLPTAGMLLCEAFIYNKHEHLVIYGFAGKNAHQTLGLLVSKRMEDAGLAPLGFLPTDHALLITSLHRTNDLKGLLSLDTMDEKLADWLAGTSIYRRSFRHVAVIAGMIVRNHAGAQKSGRQATFSSDILYDTLRRYEPEHLLLKAAEEDADQHLADMDRLREMTHAFSNPELIELDRVSPLAAPLLLEFGRVKLFGEGTEELARRLAEDLMQQSGLNSIADFGFR